jgi:hypothetical protein
VGELVPRSDEASACSLAGLRWLDDVAGEHITATAATLSAEELIMAQKRGRTRDLETTVSDLLAEFEE